jgi:hypothetical protein
VNTPNQVSRRLAHRTNIRAVTSLSSLENERGGSSLSEARMQLYSRYAALVAGEFEALEAGRRDEAMRLGEERALVHDEWEELAKTASAPGAFAEALDEASREQSHRDAVDTALRDQLSVLGAAAARVYETRRPASHSVAVHRPARLADGTPPPGATIDRRF